MSVRQAACVRIQRGICVCPAGTVAGLGVEGVTPARGGPAGRGGGRGLRRFEEIPHTGSSGWLNLVKFWREDRFKLLHKHMERTFNTLGPIYRERLGTQSTVNILLPSDISELFRSEGLHPDRHASTARKCMEGGNIVSHLTVVLSTTRNGAEWRADRLLLNREVMMAPAVRRFLPLLDEVARDFCRLLATRVEKEGGKEERGYSLTIDPSPDLFRFALEGSSCHVLYGERIGLFSTTPSQESQKFIFAVERMLATTPPLLYLPPRLLWRLGAPLWTQHATAWDHIFKESSVCAPPRLLEVVVGVQRESSGILGQLMDKGQLSLELIRANITELMAGGVDTTAVPLQFALYELGRNPAVQEQIRGQVRVAWARAGGDAHKALQGAPLLKGLVKETLRLYPVGITVQRYPVRDIIIQNYHIPAGTCVQACLYPLGRSRDVFQDPERFDPGRFRSLAFGFGARQCVGRRIAENPSPAAATDARE
uniref:steroid 11beta-monooxygenase n=1 Tax=Oncorhynchus tshawytscha TaxID=74940 RepID=A0AAZ3PSY3_ONCTS